MKFGCSIGIFLAGPRSAVGRAVSYWRKYVHEVLVNRLGGLSLPRKSVVRLTDRPDMTLDVYRGRKTTNQPMVFFSILHILYVEARISRSV